MVRMRPNAARRALSKSTTTRLSLPSKRASLRTRFYRTTPRRRKWLSERDPGTVPAAPSGMFVRVTISRQTVERRVNTISTATLERWAMIDAGVLPEDDDTPPVPSDDELDEMRAEGVHEVEAWGTARNEAIREDAAAEERELEAEAERLEDEAAGAGAAGRALRRQAARKREQVAEVYEQAARDLEQVADTVRERRKEVRDEVQRVADDAAAKVAKRVAKLKDGLHDEVERAVNITYFGAPDNYRGDPDAELVEYSFE